MLIEQHRQIRELQHADMLRDAELWRLLRQGQREARPWHLRAGCWLLCQLGELLVQAGQRLQQVQATQM
jgi:hypothetical protein